MFQKQDLVFDPNKSANNPLADLAQDMQKIQETKIPSKPQTRKVRLVMTASCGCGALPVDIEREVPYDSDLKDGDGITHDQLLPTDELV